LSIGLNISFIFIRLEKLESGLLNGEVTMKGYCKQKWKILEPHAPSSVSKQIQALQKKLETTKLSEVGIVANPVWKNFMPVLYLLALFCDLFPFQNTF
jgi:hypothetical protein